MAEMIAMLNGVNAVPNGSIVPMAPDINWRSRIGEQAARAPRTFGEAPASDLDTATTKAALWVLVAVGVASIFFFGSQRAAAERAAAKGVSGMRRRRKGRK